MAVGGGLGRIESALRDLRVAHVERAASGEFVLVAIDARSLDAVGTWPWSRQVHADLLNRLTEAGAAEVFFDVDFAFAADPAGDRAFAEALERAGNVSLPEFVQTDRFGSGGTKRTGPYAAFNSRAWPVSVNVSTDRSGLVRDYPMGRSGEQGFVPSAGAFLSGRYSETSAHFGINFTLDPATVPSFSAFDVLAGAVPPEAFAGRVVIVGATAVQLGDFFNVPVHGIVPGAMIHALAAETLAQSLTIGELRVDIVLGVLIAILFVLQSGRLDKPARLLAALVLCVAATEALAFGLLVKAHVMLPTAVPYVTLGCFALWLLAKRLDLRDWIIRRQSTEVREAKELLNQVFLDSFDAIFLIDETGGIVLQSRSAGGILGRCAETVRDLPPSLRQDVLGALGGEIPMPLGLRKTVARCGEGERHLEYTVTPSSVAELKGNRSVPKRIATLSVRDVTVQREQERRIAYLSSYDDLTGALRRNPFLDFLGLRMEAGESFAVIVLNLHRFKTINVLLGRGIGDAVLGETVSRLERSEPGLSAVARLEGDTFAVFTEGKADETEAAALAAALRDLIEAPFFVGNAQARVGARVGYTIVPAGSASTPAEVLSQAEEALDAARSSNTFVPQVHDVVRTERQRHAREIERAMDGALERGEFFVTYQPQHRVRDGRLIGSEALVRWHSAELGPVFPDEFIEIAESTGFIVELGRWVLRKSLEDTLRLPGELSVAVNVSGAQMLGNDILHDVTACLAATGFPPSRLCLEMTESVFMSSAEDIVESMRDIRFTGATWALDDFGTGYSSLGYLATFPLDKLKLDRSFTAGLGTDPTALAILRSVRDLCGGLGIGLLCEGVETGAQLAALRANGCDEAQGYLFAKPLTFSEFCDYARRNLAHGSSLAQ